MVLNFFPTVLFDGSTVYMYMVYVVGK